MAQAFTTLFCQVVAMGRGLNTIRKFPSILVRIIHHLMPEQASGKDHFIPDHTARSRHSTPEHTERTEHLILDPKTRIRHLTPDHTTSESCHHVLADDTGRIKTGCKVLTKEGQREQSLVIQKKAYKIERLKKLGATVFEGSTNPADAENWLNMLEKCFDVMNCPEE
ncbi:uncharacterized protein E5676_scaffold487G00690 [Cucumis melo var. makuwa]|uniref:Uncharacterized protein n=1 Tax=Cucumis melo var. makuwa TaxID=1194695 RepID=A0A5D3BG14_CUCMM|nr:uncharacterized protein E6C27_scaffold36G00760 [Cucumis melo var. makuwa]TYJ98036.1 uncharacterized protein E5676_scaffold487G00690 [Cucumis melo var. makuwa]